ncbi:MAG: SpoIIE family protein phosphatase [Anaerolineae bacterium]|nr:SpoIIE family protein phosphatase [Anaerolineae bacterium]
MKITYANLLAVDPNETRINTLTETMQKQGWYSVTACTNSKTAQFLIASKAFDAILLDVNLASEDNFQILTRIRANPRYSQIPVIVLAETDEHPLVTTALEHGATDYIRMPTNETLLKTRLSTHLQQREIRAQALSCLDAFNAMKKLADDLREVILPLGIALSAENSFDLLLERIVREAKEICNADAGTLYLRSGNQLNFVIMHTDSLDLAYGGANRLPVPFAPLPLYDEAGQPNHHNVATHVALEGQSVNISDVYDADGFDFSGTKAFDQKNQYRSISCLTVPLKNKEVMGVLQLLNAKTPEDDHIIPFSIYHKLVAESLASQAAIVMHNHVLRERQKELLQAEQELQIGRKVQADFLPREIPQPPGWDIGVYFEPSRIVAGDFYDVFHMPLNKIGLIIADVCDKGVGAAIFMAQVRSLLRAFIQQHYFLANHNLLSQEMSDFILPNELTAFQPIDLAALFDAVALTNVNIGNNHGDTNMFVTVFIASLDPQTGEFIYINCGHPPTLVFNETGLKEKLMPTGPAIGLMPMANYRIKSGKLERGDTLLAYTDGITEARDLEGDLFGEERLIEGVAERPFSAPNLLHHIVNKVHTHMGLAGQYDDITMLAVQRK